MTEAYNQTINDLEIAIRNCGLFEFKQRRIYKKELEHYERQKENHFKHLKK